MKALNLFPISHVDSKGFYDRKNDAASIYHLLNKTKTSIGNRLLKKWLKQPLRNLTEINRRLNIVEYFVDNDPHRTAIQTENFHNFPDIDKLFAKFYKVKNNKRNNATLADCVKCYNLILSLEQLYDFLNLLDLPPTHEINQSYTSPLKDALAEFEKLKKMIEESIGWVCLGGDKFLLRVLLVAWEICYFLK
jgi:DNA mismatch repair protein MSH2